MGPTRHILLFILSPPSLSLFSLLPLLSPLSIPHRSCLPLMRRGGAPSPSTARASLACRGREERRLGERRAGARAAAERPPSHAVYKRSTGWAGCGRASEPRPGERQRASGGRPPCLAPNCGSMDDLDRRAHGRGHEAPPPRPVAAVDAGSGGRASCGRAREPRPGERPRTQR